MDNNECIIRVDNIKKSFTSYVSHGKGVFSFFRRKKNITKALDDVSFKIKKGEIIALLGRNGSGKSTMLKILTGVLYLDSGSVTVLGMNPSKERAALATQIGVMFGSQHLQLSWNLPPIDTFIFMKEIYGIPDKLFKKRLNYFLKILNLHNVYKKPTRQLSLGERMKCELVASSLHSPKVLFLDEPTVGVDLPSRNAIKETIKKMRDEYGMTVVITTHVVEDISEVDRIIVFDKGRKLFDGTQSTLRSKFGRHINVTINTFNTEAVLPKLKRYGKITSKGESHIRMKITPKTFNDKTLMKLLMSSQVVDFRISDQSLSDLLGALYNAIGE